MWLSIDSCDMVSHGIVLPTRGVVQFENRQQDRSYSVETDVLAIAEEIENLGFDGVWIGDSIVARPRLEPLNTLAAVGSITESVALGAAVYLPALRHPLHVAHQTATVDRISGGRLKLGVGVGIGPAVEHEYNQVDTQYGRRGAILDEALECLDRLWEGGTDYSGEFFSISDSDLGFYPRKKPPIYVASAAFDPKHGFPSPIRDRIAEHGDGWLPIKMGTDTFAAGIDAARGFVEENGRDSTGFQGAFYQDVLVAETEREALEEAQKFLEDYYPTWGGSESSFTDERIRSFGVFGPPEKIQDHLQSYRQAGVEMFVTRFPTDDQHRQLRRYVDILG